MSGEVRSLNVFDGEEDGVGIFYLLTIFILLLGSQYQRSLTFLFKMLVVIIRRSIGIVIHQSERNLGISIQICWELAIQAIALVIF